MSVDSALAQMIDSMDSVDFITRQTEYLMKYFRDNPDVIMTQTLTGRYTVGYVNRDKIDKVILNLGPAFINAESYVCGLLETETLEAAGIYQVQQQPYLDLKGRGVLIGFVDTGIDFTKNIFRYEDGTSKIQFIFDQTVRGNTPKDFFIGTEYTNAQINEALKAPNPYDVVPQKDTVGHGTFLASIAAGREDESGFIGAAPDSELIVVKLRKARPYYLERYMIPPEQENAFETSEIMIGIEYILRKARELGRPVAICIALGTTFGGHDGTSIFEEYLSQISNLRGVCICVAAGNESQARHHFQNELKSSGEEQNIDIRIGGNAQSFPIAIRNTAADRISVSVRSPTGEVVSRLPARSGTRTEANLVLEQTHITIEYFFPAETSGDQVTLVFLQNATPGIWTITVHGDIVLDGIYHAWLPLTGFISPSVGFLNPTSYTTTVVPATAFGIIACGAYNSKTDSLYFNTSWGPTRAQVLKPDLVAPGVNVEGVYPIGTGTMDGTSVAASITTGAGALLLQWGIVKKNDISMSTYHIRAYLIRGCSRNETIFYPNQQWGYGSLNLMETFNLMREI
jgi:subtilisin family serine protease